MKVNSTLGSLAFAGFLLGSVAFGQVAGKGKVAIQDLTLVNESAAGKMEKVEFHHHHHHHHGHHFDHHHHHHHHHHGHHFDHHHHGFHHHHGYKSSAADVKKSVPAPKVNLG